jgi:hypothetical protein
MAIPLCTVIVRFHVAYVHAAIVTLIDHVNKPLFLQECKSSTNFFSADAKRWEAQ